MTMGLVYFLLFIGAGAAIIYWYGHKSVVARKRAKYSLCNQQKNQIGNDSILALRRGHIGKSKANPEFETSLDRADVWQSEHQRRRNWFNQTSDSITGTKYTYKRPKRDRSAAAGSK
jgi:hypothetical protein